MTVGNKVNNIVLSCYMTTLKDPQADIYRKPNHEAYIAKWYKSLSVLDASTKVVVVHDGLSDAFCLRHKRVDWVLVEPMPISINDQRFIHWYRQLSSISNVDYAITTDISDVVFVRDPFRWMKETGFPLFFGRDSHKTIGESAWLTERIAKYCKTSLKPNLPMLNAGVVGGRYEEVCDFLKRVGLKVWEYGADGNCNMAVVNVVAHSHFKRSDLWMGFPFTSDFKKHEKPSVCEAFIIHK